MAEAETDGRRRKGRRRREQILAATLRLIADGGLAAVSQRTVARAAGVPPSAVTYYYPTVDGLLVAALTACNDDYLARLEQCAAAADPLGKLAVLIAAGSAGRAHVAAEYELFLLAARRPDLRTEAMRWARGVDRFMAPLIAEESRRAGIGAAVDGLFLRCLADPDPPSAGQVRALLAALIEAPGGQLS